MRVSLESSLLAWVRYDAVRRNLQVQFRSGERYLYFQVPPVCYHDLLEADSKGAYFNRHIRNCFPYQNLSRSAAPVTLAAPRKTK
jgi:hypothetical protein